MMSSETPPYIDSPTENLTFSNPLCNSDACYAFYTAHQLSQKEVSYYHQFDYGHYITYFLAVVLFLFTLSHIRQHLRSRFRRHATDPSTISPRQKLLALIRSLSYRRLPSLPSAGLLILILLFILYSLLLTFSIRPYYRQHRGYGSPPLAIRTGLMSVALVPWTVALAGKANLISFLTGIGHERLNVLHRWVAWVCAGLAVVHTVPFIVAPLRDGGYAALKKQFYEPGGYEYTGTPALGIFFGIVLFSLSPVRRRCYELFVHSHILLAITFLGLLFWHCGNEGDSWAYLYATVALWLTSLLLRAFWFTRPFNILSTSWGHGYSVSATVLEGGMISLSIDAEGMKCRVGQYLYLRVPQVGKMDNHPFTIASCNGGDMKLLIRPRNGFTRRLAASLAQDTGKGRKVEAWVEGPYGGHTLDFDRWEHVLLVAGGGGISAMLPVMQELSQQIREERTAVKSVRLPWSVREKQSVHWIGEELRDVEIDGFLVRVDVHVTSDQSRSVDGGEKALAQVDVDDALPVSVEYHEGRIDWSADLFGGLEKGARAMVIGCGPPGLKIDLSNTCARAQKKVLRGQLGEVALRTETFDW